MKKKSEKNDAFHSEEKHHLKRDHPEEKTEKREDERHEKEDHEDDEKRTLKPHKETRPHQYKQFIFSFDRRMGLMDDFKKFEALLESRGYKKNTPCPCSDDLQLWTGTTDLAGTDPNNPNNGKPPCAPLAGIYGCSNFSVFDPCSEKLRPKKITIRHIPQPKKPAQRVVVAVIDSGVEEEDRLLNPASKQESYLFHNQKGENICNRPMEEGIYGMNVLNIPPHSGDPEPEDYVGHGTFVCGTLAGMVEPAGEHLGGNENIRLELLNVKFVHQLETGGFLFDAFCGTFYALKKGAKVINASWRTLAEPQIPAETRVFDILMNKIRESDVLLVAAAGNDKKDLDDVNECKALPASFTYDSDYSKNVISVGAWDTMKNDIAWFSNRGLKYVDIYAPGAGLTSLGLGNTTHEGDGTSYSTPFVARVAAILRGLYPNASSEQIKFHILKNSDLVKAPTFYPDPNTTVRLLNHKKIISAPIRE